MGGREIDEGGGGGFKKKERKGDTFWSAVGRTKDMGKDTARALRGDSSSGRFCRKWDEDEIIKMTTIIIISPESKPT